MKTINTTLKMKGENKEQIRQKDMAKREGNKNVGLLERREEIEMQKCRNKRKHKRKGGNKEEKGV